MNKTFANIRTGVVGVGSMGQNHARIYSEISNLVCVSDPNEEQGKKVAEKYGANYYSDYTEMLDKVDAVSIAVPTTFHSKISEDFANAGINILVEKPLAQSSYEAQKIIDVSEKNNIILSVGHIERHNEVVKFLKQHLEDGEWGKLISISARRFSSYPARIRDVGVIFDLTIHDVDVISYLVGSEVHSLFATGGNFLNEKFEDHVILTLNFPNNIVGLCETNWLTPVKVRDISITTDKYFIQADYIEQEVKLYKSNYSDVDQSNLFRSGAKNKVEIIKLEKVEPLKTEIIDFLESSISKKSPLVTGLQGLQAVVVVEKALDSMSSGKKLKISK